MFDWFRRKKPLKAAVSGTTASYDPAMEFMNPASQFNADSLSGPHSDDTPPCDTSGSDDSAGDCDSSSFDAGGGGDSGGGGADGDF